MTERFDFPVGVRVLLQQLAESFERCDEMIDEFRAWAESEGLSSEYMIALTLRGYPVLAMCRRSGYADQRIMLPAGDGDEAYPRTNEVLHAPV